MLGPKWRSTIRAVVQLKCMALEASKARPPPPQLGAPVRCPASRSGISSSRISVDLRRVAWDSYPTIVTSNLTNPDLYIGVSVFSGPLQHGGCPRISINRHGSPPPKKRQAHMERRKQSVDSVPHPVGRDGVLLHAAACKSLPSKPGVVPGAHALI